MEIIPAILTSSPDELKQMLNALTAAFAESPSSRPDRVQIDIIDGVFAANKTVDPVSLKYLQTDFKLDFQLMVKEPVNWVEKCIQVGADRIIGHLESMSSQTSFVHRVHSSGLKVGLGLDLETPLEHLEPEILPLVDTILLMSVKAGFGGQQFEPAAFSKVKSLSEKRHNENLSFSICVDGGITLELVSKLAQEGADELAIGRRLFAGNIMENMIRFKKKSLKK